MTASPNSSDCHPVLESEVKNSTSRYIKRRCDLEEAENIMCLCVHNGTQCVAEQMVHSFRLRNVIRAEAVSILSRYILPRNVVTLLQDLLNIPVHVDEEEEGCFHVTPCGIKLLGHQKQN
jgi:hypothetical protein